jgi:hypothetical protein
LDDFILYGQPYLTIFYGIDPLGGDQFASLKDGSLCKYEVCDDVRNRFSQDLFHLSDPFAGSQLCASGELPRRSLQFKNVLL